VEQKKFIILPASAFLIALLSAVFPQLLKPLDFLIVPLLGAIMLGMGTTLSLNDFKQTARQFKAVMTGLLLQFLLMPLLAFFIGKLCQLPPEQFTGLVMVGCVSGGTASNVITYLAGGNVALSITMTACSNPEPCSA
jgi:BASS family bile acid:Na+ symporter